MSASREERKATVYLGGLSYSLGLPLLRLTPEEKRKLGKPEEEVVERGGNRTFGDLFGPWKSSCISPSKSQGS